MRPILYVVIAAVVALAVVGGLSGYFLPTTGGRGGEGAVAAGGAALTQGAENEETAVKTEATGATEVVVSTTTIGGSVVKYVVPPDEIISGGPPKDGIPSIDTPKFMSAEEADEFLDPDDIVIGLFYKGEARAYPHRILVWHEIVNDVVAGDPVAVTWCPLCFSAITYLRVLGEPVEFGVSGKLYNSDLVMYDRKTDTYWSQILGIAILGELAGHRLEAIQTDVMTWSAWKGLHPDTKVLSPETGYLRNYDVDPYGRYYVDRYLIAPVKHLDDRLHPKALVYGLIINGEQKAYAVASIAKQRVLNDLVGGEPIVVVSPFEGFVRAYSREVDGQTLEFEWRGGAIFDKQTGSEWSVYGEAVSGPMKGTRLNQVLVVHSFWFAWAAFYPSTDLYGEAP